MMNRPRRTFIKQASTATAGLWLLPHLTSAATLSTASSGIEETLRKIVPINDARIEDLLAMQLNRPGDRWDGGAQNAYELPNAHSTYGFIVRLASSYACEYSRYYQAKTLEQPLERAIACLLRVQYADGTIDLHSTNFHSTPDTAFLVNYLSPVYVCIKRMNTDGLSSFIDKLGEFMLNAGKCFLSGGIHTANHRWVVSSALARVNDFFPDERYVNRIDQWLGEGIDIDSDGQYTERSVSVYSPVCNNMFLTMARLLRRPKLMDVVRANLEMSLYYIHPDGEVLTDASDRQDSAQLGLVNKYYLAYRYFAIEDNNPQFAAVCELIEKEMPERIISYILPLIEDPIFKENIKAVGKIPDDYFKRFEHSGLFRIRRGAIDISVIEQNPTFLSFRKGAAVMQSMRLAASFFGRGQFQAEQVEFDGSMIILKKSITRGYYQPIEEERQSGDNDWAKTPRDERKLSEAQTLNMIVTIKESKGALTIEVDITGTPHVPVAWELSFREGGRLENVQKDNMVEDVYFIDEGNARYRHGNDVIEFGAGSSPHKWTQLRGMLPKQAGMSVYITGYTPFKHQLKLS
ncbi:MAG: hypothetical protein AB8H47_08465 [Bacteroidia bacterium]